MEARGNLSNSPMLGLPQWLAELCCRFQDYHLVYAFPGSLYDTCELTVMSAL